MKLCRGCYRATGKAYLKLVRGIKEGFLEEEMPILGLKEWEEEQRKPSQDRQNDQPGQRHKEVREHEPLRN